MPQVQLVHSYEQIECQPGAGIWICEAVYCMEPDEDEVFDQGDGEIGVDLNDDYLLPLPFEWTAETDTAIRYSLMPRSFAPPQEELSISEDLFHNNAIPLAELLDFDHVGHLFEDRAGFRFQFSIVGWESVDLDEFVGGGLIEETTEEDQCQRRFRIVSNLVPRIPGNQLVLRNYPKVIGNLDREIIWQVRMFAGSRSESWQIEIDDIAQPFDSNLLGMVRQHALRSQPGPVLERIPSFLRTKYPASSEQSLEVVTIIPEIQPQIGYSIEVDLHDIAGDLFHPTGVPDLDQCIRDVCSYMLEHGIPLGPDNEVHQRVLAQLLLYRYYCGSRRGYIDTTIGEMTEIQGFHRHLEQRLGHQLEIEVVDILSEVEIGNSRVDLLLEGIPTELKLEDRLEVDTTGIVERHQEQAADYVARRGAPFGLLVVLDTVLQRDRPTSRVDQDVRVVEVPNVSGEPVLVIAIIVRIPRSASEHC